MATWIAVAWLYCLGHGVEQFYPAIWASTTPFIVGAVASAFIWVID